MAGKIVKIDPFNGFYFAWVGCDFVGAAQKFGDELGSLLAAVGFTFID